MANKETSWWRKRVQLLSIPIICSAAIFLILPSIRNSSLTAYLNMADQTGKRSVESLEQIRQRYAKAKSVHMVAEAKIVLPGTNFRAGNGSYEYWAEGNKYKIKCRTDAQLGFLKDVDIAYDGKRFYYFDRGSDLISYQHSDISKTIGALPNPLFLPVDFLSSEDDSCPFCALKLSDFKSTNTRWADRASRSQVKSHTEDRGTGHAVVDLEMPGGIKAKRPFKILARMAEAEDGKVRLIRLDQVGFDGKLLTSMSFDNFKPTALGEFPHIINAEGFDENSNLIFRMAYTITKLEIDYPLEESIFAVDFDEAERVWDSDARKLVKDKRSKSARP